MEYVVVRTDDPERPLRDDAEVVLEECLSRFERWRT
jgi:hypothetical protein